MDSQQTKHTLLETLNQKVTQDTETGTVRSDTSGTELFHNIIKAYTHVTPQDGTITAETLSTDFEAQHGNIETIREFIRTGQIVGPMLYIILNNKQLPEPKANISEYIQRVETQLSEGRVISYNSSTPALYEDSLKRREATEYLYSRYFNEHKNSINRVLLLTKLANYFSSQSLAEITSQMTEVDWDLFKETIRLDFNSKNPSKQAENDIIASICTELVKTDGSDVATSINKYPVPHLHFIAEKAVIYGKASVVHACTDKYILGRGHENPQLKYAMEENSLEAMARGNPEVCKAFLKKAMWDTYSVETKACIYSLMMHRSGFKTRTELTNYIEQEKLVIEAGVYEKYLKMNAGQNMIVDQINALNPSLEQSGDSFPDAAHSRFMEGSIHITPTDNSISVEELRAKAAMSRNPEQELQELNEKIAKNRELYFTNSVINNHMIVTYHITVPGSDKLRYKALENFNNCFTANAALRKNIGHSLTLDEKYSDYFNDPIQVANIDPVIRLLALGVPEYLSRSSLNAAKEEAKADRKYLIHAANKMLQKVSPGMGMGDIVDNIIFEDGNFALTKLKRNETFNSEDIISLRFAIIHDQENIVDYCVRKYIEAVKNKQIPYENIHKNMGEQALAAIVRGNKEICLSFIENMWEISDDVYKAQLLNLIITRSGTETRASLVEYLKVNSLLTEKLKEELYKSSPIPESIREIKEFVAPIYDQIKQKQDLIDGFKSSSRTPLEIIDFKTNPKHKPQQKLKQLHNSLAELTIACIRDFGDDKNKWQQFIQDNLSKLEKYSKITEESFTNYFGKQSFTTQANELITQIEQAKSLSNAKATSSAFEQAALIESFNNSKRSPQDILRAKVKPDNILNLFAELTITCKKIFRNDSNKWNQFIEDNLEELKKYSNIAQGDLVTHFGKQNFTAKADEMIRNIAIISERRQAEITSYYSNSRAPEEIIAAIPDPNNLQGSFIELTIACNKEFGSDRSKWNKFIEANLEELKIYGEVSALKLNKYFGKQDATDLAEGFIANISRISLERQEEIRSYNKSKRPPQEIIVNRTTDPIDKLRSFVELTIACNKVFREDSSEWNQFIERNLNKLQKYSDITGEKLRKHYGEQNFINKADEFIGRIAEAQTKEKDNSKKTTSSSVDAAQKVMPDSIDRAANTQTDKEGFIGPRKNKTSKPKEKVASEPPSKIRNASNQPERENAPLSASASAIKDNKHQSHREQQESSRKNSSGVAHEKDKKVAPPTSQSIPLTWAAKVNPEKAAKELETVAKKKPQAVSSDDKPTASIDTKKSKGTDYSKEISNDVPPAKVIRQNIVADEKGSQDTAPSSVNKPAPSGTKEPKVTAPSAVAEPVDISDEVNIQFGSVGIKDNTNTTKRKQSFTEREDDRRSRSPSSAFKDDLSDHKIATGASLKEENPKKDSIPKYEHGGLLESRTGAAIPYIIQGERTYIVKPKQDNSTTYLLQEVLISETKTAFISKSGARETKTTRVITYFIGAPTRHDLSSLYNTKNYAANIANQRAKVGIEEQSI